MNSEFQKGIQMPERPKDTFGVEFKNPDVAFVLLTSGRKVQEINIEDSWDEMTDEKYDLFRHILTLASSPMAILQRPDWPERETRSLEIDQIIFNLDKKFDVEFWRNNREKIKEELTEQGLSCYENTVNEADPKDEASYLGHECIVIDNGDCSIMIRFLKPDSSVFINGALHLDLREKVVEGKISYSPLLTDYSEFQAASATLFMGTEKLIRALYKIAGRKIPSTKIKFWPEKDNKENTNFIAMVCGSCGGGYPSEQITETSAGLLMGSPTCPHCGATDPRPLNIPLSKDS